MIGRMIGSSHLASFPDKKLPPGAEEAPRRVAKGLPGSRGCFATSWCGWGGLRVVKGLGVLSLRWCGNTLACVTVSQLLQNEHTFCSRQKCLRRLGM